MDFVDTNLFLHYVRDDALSRHIENEYQILSGPVAPFTSIVVEGELRALAEELKWGSTKRILMEELLSRCIILVVDDKPLANGSILENYIKISVFCRANGRVLSKNDLWIAVSASATQTRLLTTDKDFLPLNPLFFDTVWINPAL